MGDLTVDALLISGMLFYFFVLPAIIFYFLPPNKKEIRRAEVAKRFGYRPVGYDGFGHEEMNIFKKNIGGEEVRLFIHIFTGGEDTPEISLTAKNQTKKFFHTKNLIPNKFFHTSNLVAKIGRFSDKEEMVLDKIGAKAAKMIATYNGKWKIDQIKATGYELVVKAWPGGRVDEEAELRRIIPHLEKVLIAVKKHLETKK
jgi:hypothetical protein